MCQILNTNSGAILVTLLMHKLGIRNELNASVLMGVDNPWSVLWMLMGGRQGRRERGLTTRAGEEPPR